MRRWLLVLALAVGVGLIAAPFAFDMFERAPRGATMLSDFKPYMTAQRLDGYQADIARIDDAVSELRSSTVAAQSADYAAFQRQWPQIHATMTDLLDTVQDNLPNYNAVAALPSFSLFPWFFVIPGLLIALAAGIALRYPARANPARAALAVLGIGLVLAPAIFQMFTRAPKGGQMMSDFASLETTKTVREIQGYFADMAVGQGAIRVDTLAATLQLSPTEIAQRYPKTAALDAQWVHILNDMTPMIGAMSDNVGNYQAIAALPPFPLFPWFFVIPGVLVGGAALYSKESRENTHRRKPDRAADGGSVQLLEQRVTVD